MLFEYLNHMDNMGDSSGNRLCEQSTFSPLFLCSNVERSFDTEESSRLCIRAIMAAPESDAKSFVSDGICRSTCQLCFHMQRYLLQ